MLAVAASKYGEGKSHIDLDLLLECTQPTHRVPGRPRKIQAGDKHGGGKASPTATSPHSSNKKSAHYYRDMLESKGALYFHKWRVLKTFGEDNCVGTILSYRDDYHEERKPYTSATPYSRMWKCHYAGDSADVFEEYSASELAQLLSDAHSAGVNGPAPAQKRANQLTAILIAPLSATRNLEI